MSTPVEEVSPVRYTPPPGLGRWNGWALFGDIAAYAVALSLMDPSAVMPVLLSRLGASSLLIGLFAALRIGPVSAVQIFVAYFTYGVKHQKAPVVWICTISRLPMMLLPLFLWRADVSPGARLAALIATFSLLIFRELGDGIGYVPWMEIVARSFDERTRGRFLTGTQMAGGIIGIAAAAFLVRGILHSSAFPYPRNWAMLAVISTFCYTVSLVSIWLLKEPPPGPNAGKPRPPLALYFRQLPVLLRRNPIFVRLAVIQLLIGFGAAPANFYVLYAVARFHLPDEWAGIYQAMQGIGLALLMPLYAGLSERRGPAAAVRGVAFTMLATPLVALTVGRINPWFFGLVFLLMGGSLGWGVWIAMSHYLLSHTTEEERPTFVALLSLISTPAALYPFLGSLLVRGGNFISIGELPVLFLLTALVIGIGCRLSMRLPAPDTESS